MSDLFEMDLEPEPRMALDESYAPVATAEVIPFVAPVSIVAHPHIMAVRAKSLPDFDMESLLTFLPDVRLKQDLEAAVVTASAIEVKGNAGIVAADEALAVVREKVKAIAACFDGTDAEPGPVKLANQLHKRLTGLRADFTATGEECVALVGKRIYDETQRLKREAVDAQRKAQQEADAQAKQEAQAALERAKAQQAKPEVVEALQEQVRTAVAPPVPAPAATPPPIKAAHSSVIEKRKVRLIETPPDGEAQPADLTSLTPPQRMSVLVLLKAIVDGKAPLQCVKMDWSYLDKRANADKAAFVVPGLETYDAGGVRGKAGRK